MRGLKVVEGAKGADLVGGGAVGGHVTIVPTVSALRVAVGGEHPFNVSVAGEEPDKTDNSHDVARVHGDNDGRR